MMYMICRYRPIVKPYIGGGGRKTVYRRSMDVPLLMGLVDVSMKPASDDAIAGIATDKEGINR